LADAATAARYTIASWFPPRAIWFLSAARRTNVLNINFSPLFIIGSSSTGANFSDARYTDIIRRGILSAWIV